MDRIQSYKAVFIVEDSNEDFHHVEVWRSQIKMFEDKNLDVGTIENLTKQLEEEVFESSIGANFRLKYKVPNQEDQNLKLLEISILYAEVPKMKLPLS